MHNVTREMAVTAEVWGRVKYTKSLKRGMVLKRPKMECGVSPKYDENGEKTARRRLTWKLLSVSFDGKGDAAPHA